MPQRRHTLTKVESFPNPQWTSYQPAPNGAVSGDRAVVRAFLSSRKSTPERYAALFRYFVEGFSSVATPTYERAHYRGMGSHHGYSVSGVEGFARTAPLIAAWLASGRPGVLSRRRGREPVDLSAVLVSGLSHGADPESETYWGDVRSNPQLIVEAADIALVLWLAKDLVWKRLSRSSRRNLVIWLRSAIEAPTPRNNWLLLGMVIKAALGALENRKVSATAGYREFKTHYIERGWFGDMSRTVDFYNAWGITYPLFWIHRMQPRFDAPFLRGVVLDSGAFVSHLISPKGIPIVGRSVCYRTAAAAPVVLRAFLDRTLEWQGLARRALDRTWRYFVAHGALRDGTLTQGYFGDDPRVLDSYSGPGSSHWGLRSLIPALLFEDSSLFWTVPEHPLPVETVDYRIDAPGLGWIVEGDRATGDIRITIPANRGQNPRLQPYTDRMRGAEQLLGVPRRPPNAMAKYGAEVYSAIDPFPLRP